MANTSGIRAHMKSVGSIGKITGAMQMVASARMHQAEQRANASLPFAVKLKELLQEAISDPSVLAHLDPVKNPLLEQRPVYKTAYIVIGSDKGLAGAYNSNVVKHTAIELRGRENSPLIAVGKQMRIGLEHRAFNVVRTWNGFSEKPTFEAAEEVADYVSSMFIHHEVDEVDIIYTYFKSPMVQIPRTVTLLPIKAKFGEEDEEERAQMVWDTKDSTDFTTIIYEPSAGEMLPYLAQYYLRSQIFTAFIQSAASELAARMTAMTTATDNANTLLGKLRIHYQKVRQSSITTEINEIVGGAEALK
jgi:F-type H+-transporting ATPase subunit gamma